MVTNYGGTGDLMCSSTDVKPTDVAVNTRCLELDTGKFWYFNGTSWTETPGGGGGGSATLIEKSITANGTYTASSDNADGYSSVDVDVPNTYTVGDNGKVVSNQMLVAQTAKPDTITVNDTYNTTEYNSVTVNVPNSYTAADEGKVVSGGDLVAQTAYPSTITANNTYDTTNYNSVTIDVPTGGGSIVEEKDVNFYDYDGTIVYSYTKQEFLALSEMPSNPTHTGLTAQGWNWSLADAKTYVTAYGKLDIGQMYVTDDGKTRLYIHLEEGRLSPRLILNSGTVGNGVVDWGDGSTVNVQVSSGNINPYSHTYASAGDYVITITVTSGAFQMYYHSHNYQSIISGADTTLTSPNRAYKNSLIKCEIGTGFTYIMDNAFYGCSSLKSVTIPSSCKIAGTYAFYGCTSLKSVVIPNTVTSIGNSLFGGCKSLTSVTIPNTIRTIDQQAFDNCTSLASIEIPSGVTSIAQSVFNNCNSLTSITIPNGVTSISSSAFQGCESLAAIDIPSSVTSIGTYVFNGCYALTSMEIPSSVASIGSNTFQNCYSLAYIDIDKATDSISGSPWSAITSSPTSTQIIWHD